MRLSMRAIRPTGVALAFTGLLTAGCAVCPVSDGSGSPQPQPSGRSSGPALERVTEQDAARIRGIIGPLAKASDHPPSKLTVGILSDKSINAANAGNGEFYVTRGLLNRANDFSIIELLKKIVRFHVLVSYQLPLAHPPPKLPPHPLNPPPPPEPRLNPPPLTPPPMGGLQTVRLPLGP